MQAEPPPPGCVPRDLNHIITGTWSSSVGPGGGHKSKLNNDHPWSQYIWLCSAHSAFISAFYYRASRCSVRRRLDVAMNHRTGLLSHFHRNPLNCTSLIPHTPGPKISGESRELWPPYISCICRHF